MNISISTGTNIYANMYSPKKTNSTPDNSSTTEILKTENTSTALLGARIELPNENLKKEDYLGEIQFANDTHAVAYRDENFSEEHPVVKVYSKNPTTGEWTKTTVDLNSVDKNNMSVLESYGVGNALEALGKTGTNGSLHCFIAGFNELHNFKSDYTYEDLFEKYDVKAMFTKEMQTQYKFGNMQGYMYYKRFYDAFFAE